MKDWWKKFKGKIEERRIKERNEGISEFLIENPEFKELDKAEIVKEYHFHIRTETERSTNTIMVVLTLIIVISAILSYNASYRETVAIENSYLPQVYYSEGKCPEEISSRSDAYLQIYFGNYGKIPARDFTILDHGYNTISRQISGGVDYEDHTDTFVMVPIEYKDNQRDNLNYVIRVNNTNISTASFLLEWHYIIRGDELGRGNIVCDYFKEDGTFKLSDGKFFAGEIMLNVENIKDFEY